MDDGARVDGAVEGDGQIRLEDLAAGLAEMARAADRPRGPFVVGVVGSVAVGKSTFANELAVALGAFAPVADAEPLRAEVVATDSFLLPNAELEPLGGAMVKGHPQSYDWAALDRFLAAAAGGESVLTVPVYSHETFDIVPGATRMLSTPDVLVVEGLNLLQDPPTAPLDVAGHLDRSLYLDAPEAVIEQWFVDRFLVVARAEHAPDGFYAMFDGMDDAEVESVARWTWDEINAPNLHRHIAPTRSRADVVVHKAADHSIERVEQQRH